MWQSVQPYAAVAGIEEPVVCYQGAVVVEPTTGRFLRHVPIEIETAREVVAAVAEEGLPLNCYVDDELYVAERTPESDRYAGFQRLRVHVVGDLLEWLDHPPTKLVTVGDPDLLDRVEARMKERFGGRLFISKSLPYFLEFASPEVSKGSGLAFVADLLGFALDRTIGIGDGENDRELLEWSGYGVAVANAHPRILEIADWICPSADDEGVAQVIEAVLDSRV
jgi:Cof subfamily protein (haloacid dehalogenase superfamily)